MVVAMSKVARIRREALGLALAGGGPETSLELAALFGSGRDWPRARRREREKCATAHPVIFSKIAILPSCLIFSSNSQPMWLPS
jgi:hypothetical protein